MLRLELEFLTATAWRELRLNLVSEGNGVVAACCSASFADPDSRSWGTNQSVVRCTLDGAAAIQNFIKRS